MEHATGALLFERSRIVIHARASRPRPVDLPKSISKSPNELFRRGCVYLPDANHTWFWGVDFQITSRKSYGHVPTLDEAKAAFRAEYEAWKARG
jgi:hypothetical protein